MRELALFVGAGGGILGSILLGHRIVGAVEIKFQSWLRLHIGALKRLLRK